MIKVTLCEESGYPAALRGLSFNKKKDPKDMERVAKRLSQFDGGHNKFLEMIIIWLEVKAPRYWWQEADTYRLSTKQSESTMHILIEEIKDLDDNMLMDFGSFNFEMNPGMKVLKELRYQATKNDISKLKALLPEGYLQRRMWCMSYKTLRNMYIQRKNHRLPLWQHFLSQTLEQIDHPEFITGE